MHKLPIQFKNLLFEKTDGGDRLTQQKAMMITKAMLFYGSLDFGNASLESAARKAGDLFRIGIASQKSL